LPAPNATASEEKTATISSVISSTVNGDTLILRAMVVDDGLRGCLYAVKKEV
jgi:hypothetical protein